MRGGRHTLHQCPAEFPHLEGSPLKERRKEADRLVRAALQVLLQHSYVLTYLVQPLSTRQNPQPHGVPDLLRGCGRDYPQYQVTQSQQNLHQCMHHVFLGNYMEKL